MCEAGRDVMGCPCGRPTAVQTHFFGSAWGPASRTPAGGHAQLGCQSFGRRWLGTSVGERVFEVFICVGAQALAQRALWAHEPVWAVGQVALVCLGLDAAAVPLCCVVW